MATLKDRVRSWTTGRNKSGVAGLILMLDLSDSIAVNRDWDAAAHLLAGLQKNDPRAATIFKMVLRARFGRLLKSGKSDKHSTGIAFKMDWPHGEIPPVGNAWGHVRISVEKGLSFTSKEFLDKLREQLGVGKEKPKGDATKYAKNILKWCEDRKIDPTLIINALTASVKEARAVNKPRPAEPRDADGKVAVNF